MKYAERVKEVLHLTSPGGLKIFPNGSVKPTELSGIWSQLITFTNEELENDSDAVLKTKVIGRLNNMKAGVNDMIADRLEELEIK